MTIGTPRITFGDFFEKQSYLYLSDRLGNIELLFPSDVVEV